jgi:hypothetical protein
MVFQFTAFLLLIDSQDIHSTTCSGKFRGRRLELAMARRWNEPGGQVIFDSLGVLDQFTRILRTDIGFIAEKQRSLGFLNESTSDVLADLSANQYPTAKAILMKFVQSLAQVEYGRKVMYFRTHRLADQAFQGLPEQAKHCREHLQRREIAYTRHARAVQQRAQNPKIDPRPLANFREATQQATEIVMPTFNQIHMDLIRTITAFAHAQLEKHARALEVWSRAVTEIDGIAFDDEEADMEDQFTEILASLQHDLPDV